MNDFVPTQDFIRHQFGSHGQGTPVLPYLADDEVFGTWQRILRVAVAMVSLVGPESRDSPRASPDPRVNDYEWRINIARRKWPQHGT